MGGGLTMIIRAQEKMSEESFAYLIRHSYHFFSSSFSGALVRKVGRYKDAYERLYYSIQTSVLPAVLYIVGITTVLFLRNVLLGSILLAWVLLFIFAQWILIRRQQPLRHKRVEEDSNLTATLADAIGNQNTIALFAATQYEDARVHDASTRLHTALRKLWHFDLTMYGIQGILSIIIQIGLLWAAFIFQQRGALTVGDIVLIQAYIFGLFNHVWGLGREFPTVARLLNMGDTPSDTRLIAPESGAAPAIAPPIRPPRYPTPASPAEADMPSARSIRGIIGAR
jgi:ABC-type multidrug transport system fused ATPase/permease subunit